MRNFQYIFVYMEVNIFMKIIWVCDIDRFIKTQKVDWDIVERYYKK